MCSSISVRGPGEQVAVQRRPPAVAQGDRPRGVLGNCPAFPGCGSPLQTQPSFCHSVGHLRLSENPPPRPCASYYGNQEGWACRLGDRPSAPAKQGTRIPGTGIGRLRPKEGPRGPAAKTRPVPEEPSEESSSSSGSSGGPPPLRAAQGPRSASSSTEGGVHRPDPPGSAGMTQAVSFCHPGTRCCLVQPEERGPAPLGARQGARASYDHRMKAKEKNKNKNRNFSSSSFICLF